MIHTEREMLALKEETQQMWRLVISQLEKAKQALLQSDVALAMEVVSRERRVDAFELKIDSDCENYIALYNPVAIDLRLCLSLIKIANTLERIGDFAESIAKHVIDEDCNNMDLELLEELQLELMLDMVLGMLSDSFAALEHENTKISGVILAKDEEVDSIYRQSIGVLSEYMKNNPDYNPCGLKVFLLVRRIERIGDHCCNLVEEIVFYIDAKVLKHRGKNLKKQ